MDAFFGYLSVIIIFIVSLTIIIRNYTSKNQYEFWSPLTIVSLLYLYYVVINPISILVSGDVYYLGVNMKDSANSSWIAAMLSYISILVGFSVFKKKNKRSLFNFNVNLKMLKKSGIFLFFLGYSFWVYTRGIQINVFEVDNDRKFVTDGLSMYFVMGISFLVASSCLLFIYYLKSDKSKGKMFLFLIPLLITILTFITQGSRFRLVFLLFAMATVYYVIKKRRPNILVWVFFSIFFFIGMGVIELTRNYSRGLDISKLKDYDVSEISSNAQNETKVFFFSGQVIDYVSKNNDYIYFEPFYTALLMPVPRAFFPSKPDGKYLTDIQDAVLGDSSMGAAFLFYAEFFYAFGWFGVLIASFFLGFFIKYFWLNFLQNPENSIALISLALFNGFVFVMISRGYLAQQFFSYMYFIIIPLWVAKKINIKLK